MPDYSLFGECLRSELTFSDLRPSTEAIPRWRLRVASEPHIVDGEIIGEMLTPPCTVRLRKNEKGFTLSHSCTAEYHVSHDGVDITCAPIPAADSESLHYDVANRVMAVALHAGGALCLHASAVQLSGGVIAFLAPKGYGKSTLASALLGGGAKLVTDDMLVVELSREAYALPGIFGLRLRDDSAQKLIGSALHSRRGVDGKHVVDALPDDRLMLEKAPLAAIYILAPVAYTEGEPVLTRTHLPPRAAAVSIITHARIAALLGRTEAPVLLDRAALLAQTVPVFRLGVARSLLHLDGVVNQLLDWHGTTPEID